MKKSILCLILIATVLFSLPMYASSYNYCENDVIFDILPGDINAVNKVTAADARLCLRAAAKLETLTKKQLKAADLDGTGEITGSDARQILRACAGLDMLTVTVNLKQGQNLVVGPLKIWGVECTPQEQYNNLTVLKTAEIENPEIVGAPASGFFTIKATESGVYNLAFTSYQPWIGDITEHFNIVLNIK